MDGLGEYFRAMGFKVRMHYYNPYKLTDNAKIIEIMNGLGINDIAIGHSWGGILAQLADPNCTVVTVNTLGKNTLRNLDDNLPAFGTYFNLGGTGHRIDTYAEYRAIQQYLESLMPEGKNTAGHGSYARI
jgi:hypothetical protein